MSATGSPQFAPDAVIRRVDAELILLAGGPRALLMQLAHPKVAQGVAEHSGFAGDPFARLRRTLEATSTIVFGTRDDARRAARHVRSVHGRVTGEGYRANDPELLLWVHATLVDTALRVHRLFLKPLSAADAEAYYQESAGVAELLGVPRSAQPPDLDAFRSYVRSMVATLEVSATARELARTVLHPRVPLVTEPAFAVARNITIGLLPPPIRAGYGLSWDAARAAALAGTMLTSRAVLPLVPGAVRRGRMRVSA